MHKEASTGISLYPFQEKREAEVMASTLNEPSDIKGETRVHSTGRVVSNLQEGFRMMYPANRNGALDEYTEKFGHECKSSNPGSAIQKHFLRGLVTNLIDQVASNPAAHVDEGSSSNRFYFDSLNLRAYDSERDQWCIIVDLDVRDDRIGLSNGCVSFWRKLSETQLRFASLEEKIESEAA